MRLRMICFNGMGFDMIESGATFSDLRAIAERRRKQGYEVTRLSPYEIEVNHETALINDMMGYVKLMREKS